ncbi:HAD family hydrolase [Jiangella anatolica]|uniref:Haloacid dehalogenase n=1 Tax=Jiangella anatolica TaxID=2670374 RepID=A0A2W2C2M5_9ACTN|nr:HAD family hydrolase [Jiangella anatolica]PZF82207.1 haloacid dehalogenase [Jiangella anatolica]
MQVTQPPWELVVFDMAGTIFSDDGLVGAAFRGGLVAAGVAGDAALDDAMATFARNRGRSKLDAFREILPDEAARRANVAFERRYEELLHAHGVTAFPGIEALFDRLRGAGVRVALTTGFAPATRQVILDALGWRDAVDLAVSPGDAGRGRPYPDMILTAVLELGVTDMHAVAVVGDTRADLVAGWRSGAGVVAGVTTGADDRSVLQAAPHTHILDSAVDIESLVGTGLTSYARR